MEKKDMHLQTLEKVLDVLKKKLKDMEETGDYSMCFDDYPVYTGFELALDSIEELMEEVNPTPKPEPCSYIYTETIPGFHPKPSMKINEEEVYVQILPTLDEENRLVKYCPICKGQLVESGYLYWTHK